MLFSDMLYMLVRYTSPSGPMCLRCLMLTLSGPMELLFLLCFIATWTCVVLSVMLVVCSLSVFMSMCLFVLCVFMFVCLFNAFAICVGEVSVFSLKVMVLFWAVLGCVGVLLASPCIVFLRVYVCVCDPSVCLGVPSICQICVFV